MTIADADPHRFMTVNEVAATLRVSRATVYRLIHTGNLPGMRVGKSVRVSRQVVEDFIHRSEPGGVR